MFILGPRELKMKFMQVSPTARRLFVVLSDDDHVRMFSRLFVFLVGFLDSETAHVSLSKFAELSTHGSPSFHFFLPSPLFSLARWTSCYLRRPARRLHRSGSMLYGGFACHLWLCFGALGCPFIFVVSSPDSFPRYRSIRIFCRHGGSYSTSSPSTQ